MVCTEVRKMYENFILLKLKVSYDLNADDRATVKV